MRLTRPPEQGRVKWCDRTAWYFVCRLSKHWELFPTPPILPITNHKIYVVFLARLPIWLFLKCKPNFDGKKSRRFSFHNSRNSSNFTETFYWNRSQLFNNPAYNLCGYVGTLFVRRSRKYTWTFYVRSDGLRWPSLNNLACQFRVAVSTAISEG